MKTNYYEVEFAHSEDMGEEEHIIHVPDRYSICIKATHYPTKEEVKEFCKEDMQKLGYDFVCDILQIDYEEAHNFFDMENEENFPILQ